MNFLPFQNETLVSILPKNEVLDNLQKVTKEVNYLDRPNEMPNEIIFNGMIGRRGFRISKVISRGDTFLPLLLGKVEETARGSIIFVSYRLFPGAVFFLGFWSIILVAFTVFFFFFVKNHLFGTICLSLAIVNYLLALFFFNRHVKSTKKLFHQQINFQTKD